MTDEQIMQSVKEGDLVKAALLFDRYHLKLYRFLGKLSSDYHQSEDMTQNVFIKMIQYRNSFDIDRSFQSWIFSIARNVYADHYASLVKNRSVYVEPANIPETADHTDYKIRDEQESRLMAALHKLTPDAQELLILTRFQHMKYDEVAALKETTVANIKVKVHRAIGKLREIYFQSENT